ncbi:MAG: radical SAM family heme chaperone HemW [Candidatus Dormibacteraeota bacterium]|nr:radical SAM family heme chaperone HemW [Candidatus Dormibacteraeota bacterium]
MSDTLSIRSLYVHIPFCERKCEYCDFTSIAGTAGADAYIEALIAEIRMLGERLPGIELDTVFIGGGTPSLIEPRQLAAVIDSVGSAFRVTRHAEVTLEANPSSTSVGRASVWRGAGANRVSLGVQSLEPDILSFLGRVHDAQRALDAVAEVRAAGFESVNCDLIYAVPGLDDARWARTVQRVIGTSPDHLSCYELTVEPGTPLHTNVRRGRVTPVDADVALGQHRLAEDLLTSAGYAQYEVSNFARPDHMCRHNLAYWHNRHYLAAGVGAHGHVPAAAARQLGLAVPSDAVAVRYWHGRGIAAFAANVRDGVLPIRDHECLDATTREEERIMLGLRLQEGVALTDDAVVAEALRLQRRGLIAFDGAVARATPHGENVLNAVTLRLTDALHLAPVISGP